MIIFVSGSIGNTLGRGENSGYYFFFVPTMFSKGFFLVVIKTWDCLVRGEPINRRQNSRLVQIETNCRQHFKVYLK